MEDRVRNSLLVRNLASNAQSSIEKWADFRFSSSILNENIPQVHKRLQSFGATSALLAKFKALFEELLGTDWIPVGFRALA